MAHHLGLLVDLLGHEMAVIALVDQGRSGRDDLRRALDHLALAVAELDGVAVQDGPVAFLEIGDHVGEGRERERVRAQIHLALADADRQRRAQTRADQQVLLALEQEGEREGAAQRGQYRAHGLDRGEPTVHLARDEMGDDLGVGLALEAMPFRLQLGPEFAEVLDDAVMDDGEPVGRVGMGVGGGWLAVGGPARVADADQPVERPARKLGLEVAQLAFGAAADQLAALERGDAGGVVAALFQPPQRLDHVERDGVLAQDSRQCRTCACLRFGSDLSGRGIRRPGRAGPFKNCVSQ